MKTRLYWIKGPWKGKVAVSPRPRGGEWLPDEINSWHEQGIRAVASLLQKNEIAHFELEEEQALSKASHMMFLPFPIPDRGVPDSKESTLEFVRKLEKLLSKGTHILIHCRQGIGRSGVLASCLLISGGEETEAAFHRIGNSRGLPVPETKEQREWVESFASELLAAGRR